MAPPLSFALLEHRTADGVHWDLLVEQGPGRLLATWRLARCPLDSPPDGAAPPVPAERIADHRRIYLEFEGELTGGRGVVRRLDRGAASIRLLDGPRLSALLHGERLRTEVCIDRLDARLVFRSVAPPAE